MKFFISSDCHYDHGNVIRYCKRPFKDTQHMNEALIKNWNRVVGANDPVYVLGDFTLGRGDRAKEFLSRLQGKKYLVKGNHDQKAVQDESYVAAWEWVKDYYELRFKEDGITQTIVMSHYPMRSWNGMHRGSIHLHGHCHGSLPESLPWNTTGGKILDVGVDVHNYTPVSWEVIKGIMATKKFQPVDHHTSDQGDE